MSAHIPCTCSTKTTLTNSDKARVIDRNLNYSHFEYPKGQAHWSQWSTLVCIGQDGRCPMHYRSKSKKVDDIPDLKKGESELWKR